MHPLLRNYSMPHVESFAFTPYPWVHGAVALTKQKILDSPVFVPDVPICACEYVCV